MAEARDSNGIPGLDLDDLMNVVVAEWSRRIAHFEMPPGYRPEITWPSPTCSPPRLPLRILTTDRS
ncbi:hypothetical protein JF781_18360 [Mycobacterium sp. WUMAC-067]|uniref:hypothetical protein n=1 Tax=unclassified Mycobacterium TaxID=2642494 RepID=UPI001CDA146E|nr:MULTISPECIES: hypothetical protein [unclassified Mycobacterium]MCA2244331.1 hypothetical protein [Mycobacterium sp. WUMAC-067]MCA2313522.1 hypothetical protein [Mycobacterium sp. WUMAC-025]